MRNKTISNSNKFWGLAQNLLHMTVKTTSVSDIISHPLSPEGEYMMLIVKPAQYTLDANINQKNIETILELMNSVGWTINNARAFDGSSITDSMLRGHYPELFQGANLNIQEYLKESERLRLIEIYGKEALNYPIIHALTLIENGVEVNQITQMWNDAIQIGFNVGNPLGVNSLTPKPDKCMVWGSKRVLLVKSPQKTYFLYNGYIGHLIERFKRHHEHILCMIFQRTPSSPFDIG